MNNYDDTFELSLTQADIYFDQLYQPSSPIYNIGGFVRCANLDFQRVCRAHQLLVESHDVFGMRVVQRENTVKQYISPQRDHGLPLLDFSNGENGEQAAMAWLDELFNTPLEFHDAQLCKAYLAKISEDCYWYVGLSHHLAMDGWGFLNWAYKLADYYNDEAATTVESSPWREIVSKDQQYLSTKRYQSDKTFWLDHCQPLPEKLLTPYYLSHYDDVNQIPSSRHKIKLSHDQFSRLRDAASAINVGVPQLVIAVLAVYFSRAYQQQRIAFGIPAHNRKNFAQKKTVGVFTSVSPLLVDVDEQQSLDVLVQQIAKSQRVSFRHQSFPIGHIMQALGVNGEHQSLYDVTFNYLKLDYSGLSFDKVDADVIYHNHNRDKQPLTVTIWDGDSEDMELHLDHNHGYFSPADIDLLAARLRHMLDWVCEPSNQQQPLQQMPILPDQEIEQLLHGFNQRKLDYPKTQLIHEIFERQVTLTPQSIAVICDEQQLSYAQLNSRANQLAHYLREQGLEVEHFVGICTERNIDMLVSVLAVLKAGGAYVALDPAYPQSRLEYVLEDTGLALLLTQSSLSNKFAYLSNVQLVALDTMNFTALLDSHPQQNPTTLATQSADKLAYAIYTSGSTGKPKGVTIKHQNTVAFLHWARGYFSREELECVLASTSINFDLSVFELLAPLSVGGRCLIVNNILSLIDGLWQDKSISLINTVPSGMAAVLAQNCVPDSVITVNLAGEALSKSLVNSLHQSCTLKRVVNLYGPSEDTTYSTVMSMPEPVETSVLIGKTIDNTQAYVLDQSRRLVPIGVAGELYLGGDGVCRGYLNRPQTTAQVFVENPFSQTPSKVLYKTADRVRYLPNGDLVYLGRNDSQVKIRGFRIELSEIELQLRRHEQVKAAFVLAVEDGSGQKQLVGYVEPLEPLDSDATADFIAVLKQHLRTLLPDFMVPGAYVLMAQWPQTPNGKIDKKALAALQSTALQGQFTAPQSDQEKALVSIFSELLSLPVDRISVTSSFFELGGHSLMTVRLLNLIERDFGLTLNLKAVFEKQDIRQLAQTCEVMLAQRQLSEQLRNSEEPDLDDIEF